jgi:DNA-binding CsgD family transcriptional regulator
MTPTNPNPWGLTARECDALAALAKHGAIQAAGKAIGVSYSQITNLIANAKRRMKAKGLVHLVLEWDRWARGGEPELTEGVRLVLTDTVVDLIARGVATNPDAMLPYCRPHSRQQVMVSVRNAVQKGRIHLVGRVVDMDGRGGQRLGVYALGPSPERESRFVPVGRPVSSVFELGARYTA